MNRSLIVSRGPVGLFLGVVLLGSVRSAGGDETAAPAVRVGDAVSVDDALRQHFGQKATAVVFLGVGCPVSNSYIPHLNELAKKYEAQGVKLVGVNANDQDSAAEAAQHAKEFSIGFPVIKDESQRIADAVGAERVPQAALIDAQGKLRYRGRIDDRYGVTSRKDAPVREDLAAALDELLAGKAVSVPETEVSGCIIGRAERKPGQPVTYSNQAARIIQRKCQTCHRSQGIAPFALDNYQQARAWAKTIKEVVVERRMPPWHADPRYGKFANDRSLSQSEIDTLTAWIDGGAAKGEDKDLPAAIEFPKGKWTIGEPDAVLAMPKEFAVPAKGVVPYQDFVVATDFKEDRWIEKAQIVPGSKAVHHAVVFLQGGHEQWLCGYVPGDSPLVLPPGTAKRLPAGAKLRFNMHYTPTGKVENDRTSLGLVFAKQPPQHEILQITVKKEDLRIPPGAADHREEKQLSISHDLKALSIMPHMHVRGKSWECRVLYPDGRTETILKVPRYDFNWQHTYRFAEPLLLPAGAKIHCLAHYDNSKNNPANPDPGKTVTWGPQSWEEMMVGVLEYQVDKGSPPVARKGSGAERLPKEQTRQAAKLLSKEAATLKDLPLKTEADVEKAFGLREGPRAAVVIPDQRLGKDLLLKTDKEVMPLGQLWLKDVALAGTAAKGTREKPRIVTISSGAQRYEVELCLLGVRKNAEGVLELVIYANGKEPLPAVPLLNADVAQGLPIELGTKKDEALTFNLLGKYQAILTLAEAGRPGRER